MTKKRFHYDRALDKFKDRNTGDDYYDCDIAELVNYLYEENKELKELDSEVDNELEIRDIVCSAGKFRLEEMGKHRYHQFYKGDEELEDEAVVIMLMELEKENKELQKENEQLKFQLQCTSAQRDEFHRGARENANRVGKLEKENEELKSKVKRYMEIELLKAEDFANCHNCRNNRSVHDGVALDGMCAIKGLINVDGYFDTEYHKLPKRTICPCWELEV